MNYTNITKEEIINELFSFATDTNLNLTNYQLSNNDVYELSKLCKKLDIYMAQEGIDYTTDLLENNEEL